MKAFVITDIHNYYGLMMQALKRAGFEEDNPEHIIISCGDLLDRGPKARECLEFINKMISQNRAHLVCGNHEALLMRLLNGGNVMSYDHSNGTIGTMKQIAQATKKAPYNEILRACRDNYRLNNYLDHLDYYYETKDYIFVHGWLPLDANFRKPIPNDYKTWENAMWYNGMHYWSLDVRHPSKKVVCGHWHTSYGHTYIHGVGVEFPEKVFTTYIGDPCDHKMHSEPFIDEGIIALDACTALTHKVNVYVIDNFEEQITKG